MTKKKEIYNASGTMFGSSRPSADVFGSSSLGKVKKQSTTKRLLGSFIMFVVGVLLSYFLLLAGGASGVGLPLIYLLILLMALLLSVFGFAKIIGIITSSIMKKGSKLNKPITGKQWMIIIGIFFIVFVIFPGVSILIRK